MNKITKKRILWIIVWMTLAWFAAPSKCSSESCAYDAIIGGILSFIFLITSSILILNFWFKICAVDKKYNLKSIDTYSFIIITLINIMLWIYLNMTDLHFV